MWRIFLAKFFRAFVGRVADRDDLNFRMALERRQMAPPHYFPRPNNSEPQFIILVSHDVERARWDSRETVFDHGSRFAFNLESFQE
jgi:hypothetical protein